MISARMSCGRAVWKATSMGKRRWAVPQEEGSVRESAGGREQAHTRLIMGSSAVRYVPGVPMAAFRLHLNNGRGTRGRNGQCGAQQEEQLAFAEVRVICWYACSGGCAASVCQSAFGCAAFAQTARALRPRAPFIGAAYVPLLGREQNCPACMASPFCGLRGWSFKDALNEYSKNGPLFPPVALYSAPPGLRA